MTALTLNQNQSLTVTDIFSPESFLSFEKFIDAKQKTVDTYNYDLKQFHIFLSSNGITAPDRDDIIAYRKYLESSGKKPTTITNYITAVRIFFKWTEEAGIYPNIARNVKGAKLDRNHKKGYLTSSQVKEVLGTIKADSLQGKRDYAIIALMVTCGLRTIEVVRANIEDLTVLGDNTILYLQGKGRDERTEYVKVPAPVEKAIRAYLKERGKAAPAEPLFISHSHNTGYTGKEDARLTTRTVSGLAKKYLQSAGYDSSMLTAHSLRHTAVTLALIGGNSLEEAQQFARHKNIATTLIYDHAIEREKNQCANTVSDAIFS